MQKRYISKKLCFFFVVCFVVVTSRSTWNLDVRPTFIERTILFYELLVWDKSYFTILSAYLITEFFYVVWLQQNRIIFKWSWSSICAMVFDYFRAFPWIKFTFCIVSFFISTCLLLYRELWCVSLFSFFFLNWFLLCFVFCIFVVCATL